MAVPRYFLLEWRDRESRNVILTMRNRKKETPVGVLWHRPQNQRDPDRNPGEDLEFVPNREGVELGLPRFFGEDWQRMRRRIRENWKNGKRERRIREETQTESRRDLRQATQEKETRIP